MSRRPASRRPALLLVALPLACSTLADRPAPESCATDKDCVGNEICGAGVCYASNLPPRTEVALDMPVAGIDAGFRLEILGTDKAVKRLDSRPTRYQVRLDNDGELSGVPDQLELRVEGNYRFNAEPIPLAVRAPPWSSPTSPSSSPRLLRPSTTGSAARGWVCSKSSSPRFP